VAGVLLRTSIEPLGEEAELQVRAQLQAETKLTDEAIDRAACSELHHRAPGVSSPFGDDVDHPIDGIWSPNRASGPANNLNVIDVAEIEVLHIPIDAFKQRRVDASAIDKDEQTLGKSAIESANTNGPRTALEASHLDARNQAKQFGNRSGARAANVFLIDHGNGCRGLPDLFRLLGDGGNFNIAELFQR
jgi:hypothetical protein